MLVTRSFRIQAAVWKKLVLNALETGVPIRDYLAFIIGKSEPIMDDQGSDWRELVTIVENNAREVAAGNAASCAVKRKSSDRGVTKA